MPETDYVERLSQSFPAFHFLLHPDTQQFLISRRSSKPLQVSVHFTIDEMIIIHKLLCPAAPDGVKDELKSLVVTQSDGHLTHDNSYQLIHKLCAQIDVVQFAKFIMESMGLTPATRYKDWTPDYFSEKNLERWDYVGKALDDKKLMENHRKYFTSRVHPKINYSFSVASAHGKPILWLKDTIVKSSLTLKEIGSRLNSVNADIARGDFADKARDFFDEAVADLREWEWIQRKVVIYYDGVYID